MISATSTHPSADLASLALLLFFAGEIVYFKILRTPAIMLNTILNRFAPNQRSPVGRTRTYDGFGPDGIGVLRVCQKDARRANFHTVAYPISSLMASQEVHLEAWFRRVTQEPRGRGRRGWSSDRL